jgi:hypothetical protein
MIMHMDLWTAGLVCDQMTVEHTREKHCDVLLILVPVRVKQVPQHKNMRYIILVLILTVMYLKQSLHDTVTHKLEM